MHNPCHLSRDALQENPCAPRLSTGYTQVIHRLYKGYAQPPPVTSCAQGPEGEGEVPLTRGGTTLFDISISIWNIYVYLGFLFYLSFYLLYFIGRPRTSTELHRTSTVLPLALGLRNFYHVEQVNL